MLLFKITKTIKSIIGKFRDLKNEMSAYSKYLKRPKESMPSVHLDIIKKGEQMPFDKTLKREDINQH